MSSTSLSGSVSRSSFSLPSPACFSNISVSFDVDLLWVSFFPFSFFWDGGCLTTSSSSFPAFSSVSVATSPSFTDTRMGLFAPLPTPPTRTLGSRLDGGLPMVIFVEGRFNLSFCSIERFRMPETIRFGLKSSSCEDAFPRVNRGAASGFFGLPFFAGCSISCFAAGAGCFSDVSSSFRGPKSMRRSTLFPKDGRSLMLAVSCGENMAEDSIEDKLS
mmetsp:Transcript_13106/g.21021  ORF Transcript_13106/g.21021 Transcript_13106/m.21021 type:complete len:217 (-) Transcript_13106:220-870(-)